VLRYFPIVRDITKIGRCDPVAGEFPEVDLAAVFPEEVARKVSRKHALIIRSRETGKISLRPLAKNTGTQVEQEICLDKTDYPLTDGSRILLGRVVRMKLEVVK
jgi:pSer/pThr/pTyr-binding forkhead associated (FHA) protein